MQKTSRYPQRDESGAFIGSIASRYELSAEQHRQIRKLLAERPRFLSDIAKELDVSTVGPKVENIRRYIESLMPVEAHLTLVTNAAGRVTFGGYELTIKGKELLAKGL